MKLAMTTALALSILLVGCSDKARDPKNSDWALLGNGSQMQHHAALAQIDRESVGKLGLAWAVDMPTTYGLVGNPLIEDGVIYQGGPGGRIFANDLRSGKLLWQFAAEYPEADTDGQSVGGYWARQFNRGVALHKDKVIIATGDCRLLAVDKKTGKQ